MSDWTAEFLQLIEDCEARESRLSEWDTNFIDSIRKQIEIGRMPSPKQSEMLNKIWERATERG